MKLLFIDFVIFNAALVYVKRMPNVGIKIFYIK